MEINRRMVIGGASAGVALSLVGEARAQASAGANGEQKLLRSIENTPWVATQSDQKKVAYVLWAPWCPYCQQVMKDVVAGSIPDLQIRWIGAGARNGSEAKAIAQVAKANSTEYLRKVVLRQDAQDVEVNPAYIQRVNSSDLLLYVLNREKKARGYPTFSFFDGSAVRTSSGYGGVASVDVVRHGARESLIAKPQAAYLEEVWKDLGAASGKPHQSNGAFTIYSQPSESSVAVKVIEKGYRWPEPTKRLIGIGKEKWVSVNTGIGFGSGPPFDGYIRIA